MSTARPNAPGPPPEPPPDLAARRLTLHTLAPGTELFRVHPLRHAHAPLYFGRGPVGRFNAPNGEFGTLYAALDPYAAFLETFARDPGVRLVSALALAENVLVRLDVKEPLALADLSGASLRRVGADTRVVSRDYQVAQRWALALWEHPQRPAGPYWRSRFDDSRYCVAVFDQAKASLDPVILGAWDSADRVSLLAAILDAYGFGLA